MLLEEDLQNSDMAWECKPSLSISVPITLLCIAATLEPWVLHCFLDGVTLPFSSSSMDCQTPNSNSGEQNCSHEPPNFTSMCNPSTKITDWNTLILQCVSWQGVI